MLNVDQYNNAASRFTAAGHASLSLPDRRNPGDGAAGTQLIHWKCGSVVMCERRCTQATPLLRSACSWAERGKQSTSDITTAKEVPFKTIASMQQTHNIQADAMSASAQVMQDPLFNSRHVGKFGSEFGAWFPGAPDSAGDIEMASHKRKLEKVGHRNNVLKALQAHSQPGCSKDAAIELVQGVASDEELWGCIQGPSGPSRAFPESVITTIARACAATIASADAAMAMPEMEEAADSSQSKGMEDGGELNLQAQMFATVTSIMFSGKEPDCKAHKDLRTQLVFTIVRMRICGGFCAALSKALQQLRACQAAAGDAMSRDLAWDDASGISPTGHATLGGYMDDLEESHATCKELWQGCVDSLTVLGVGAECLDDPGVFTTKEDDTNFYDQEVADALDAISMETPTVAGMLDVGEALSLDECKDELKTGVLARMGKKVELMMNKVRDMRVGFDKFKAEILAEIDARHAHVLGVAESAAADAAYALKEAKSAKVGTVDALDRIAQLENHIKTMGRPQMPAEMGFNNKALRTQLEGGLQEGGGGLALSNLGAEGAVKDGGGPGSPGGNASVPAAEKKELVPPGTGRHRRWEVPDQSNASARVWAASGDEGEGEEEAPQPDPASSRAAPFTAGFAAATPAGRGAGRGRRTFDTPATAVRINGFIAPDASEAVEPSAPEPSEPAASTRRTTRTATAAAKGAAAKGVVTATGKGEAAPAQLSKAPAIEPRGTQKTDARAEANKRKMAELKAKDEQQKADEQPPQPNKKGKR